MFIPQLRNIVGGRVRVMLSGGAPLAEEAHHFIRTALCVILHQGNIISNFTVKEYIKIKNIYFFYQGYGLTETTSTAAITEEDDISVGLVGAPLQGTNDEHVKKEIKMLTSCFTKKEFFFCI